ncbi:MAG: four helix bundle protein [Opitutales bacterium]|nr:four helix bundle protein [Opitutales bacterium]
MRKVIRSFRELESYQVAFEFQQMVFERSRNWPREEMYSLTDQVRRCTRSVGAAIAEAWGKRRYPAHFLSKLSDADSENQESQHWIASAGACGYLSDVERAEWFQMSERIGRLLGSMMAKHESFCIDPSNRAPR